ncbi:MAG TPA: hypothetical protein VIQ27_03480 [Gemmatimonadales bacterium]
MSDLEIGALPDRRRLALALLAGVIAGVVCWLAYLLPPPSTSDFEPVWSGARALISGRDPYAVVPTGGTRYPLYYPLPAVILGLPFGALPFPAARVLWAGLSGAVFLLAALRYRRGMLTALLSANLLNALVQGQWSPLLTAAAVFPALSWVWAAKPSIGAALFAAYPSRRALLGGLLMLAVSLAVFPSWPFRWIEALRETNHVAPVMRPGGILLLLALLRWRQAEGRLLAGLACVPQTIGLYETLPLFLIPRTRWQGYALAGLSFAAAFGQALVVPRIPGTSWEAINTARWPFIFFFLYLPALLILFLPGPARSGDVVEPDGSAHHGRR